MVKKLGDSFYILLNKDIREQLELGEGMWVSGKLQTIKVKEVGCPGCKEQFETLENEDPHDCPKCGKEFLDIERINVPLEKEKKQMKGGMRKEWNKTN